MRKMNTIDLPNNKQVSEDTGFTRKEIQLIRKNGGKAIVMRPKHTIYYVDGKDKEGNPIKIKCSSTKHVASFVLKFVKGKGYVSAPSGVPLVKKGES
tara:strand:- start:4621 stop:4911 length:291 start_codon:yes stop_codon:yes gene_type:complete